MKKRLLLWLLLLISVVGARAQETLTVYDGTNTSSNVPVYGLYTDEFLRCQFVIPDTDLEEMANGEISSMTFYLSTSASASWGAANFQVYLMEVDYTSINAFMLTADATVVYQGSLDGTGTTMTVTFTTPYVYGGGNLLVGFDNTVQGTYKSCAFWGTTVSGASVQNYSYTSVADVTPIQRNFIPKTTFEYTPGDISCPKPTELAVSNITTNSAEISWVNGGEETAWDIMINGDDGNPVRATSNPFTLTGLNAANEYTIKVRAVCSEATEESEGDISYWSQALSFATECDIITLPYAQNFESTQGGSFDNHTLPLCWTSLGDDNGYPYLHVNANASVAHTGSKCVYFSSDPSADEYLILP
ncbi:MAG: fibronectin type III domain-containing protein, partial [Bacteroidales bacterium]|nr:fibronectin type III domain-containing protein [Bacteroidales bacterium]